MRHIPTHCFASNKRLRATAVTVVALLGLSACATQTGGPAPVMYGPDYANSVCTNCGVIESISLEQHQPDNSVGAGTVLGGVAGAIIGNQIGRGYGRSAATIAGAAGGAYAGHQIEKQSGTQNYYRIAVRLDNNTRADVLQSYDPRLPVGALVRIVGDHVEPR